MALLLALFIVETVSNQCHALNWYKLLDLYVLRAILFFRKTVILLKLKNGRINRKSKEIIQLKLNVF